MGECVGEEEQSGEPGEERGGRAEDRNSGRPADKLGGDPPTPTPLSRIRTVKVKSDWSLRRARVEASVDIGCHSSAWPPPRV